MLYERLTKVPIDCCLVLLTKDIDHDLASVGAQSVRDCHSLTTRLSRHRIQRRCNATCNNCQQDGASPRSGVPVCEQTLCHGTAPLILTNFRGPTWLHLHLPRRYTCSSWKARTRATF